MDLGLTEAQEILKTAVADFVRQEYDKDTLIALENTPTGITPELFRQAADLGWLGILIPESFGGTDRSLTDTAVLFEELGRGPVLGPHFSSSVLGTLIVLLGGTEAQKQGLLPGVAQGTTVLSVAVTEPQYGWIPRHGAAAGPARQGDHYILNGTKLFVHDAQAATHLLCAARTAAPDNGSGSGITFFVVEADSPGGSDPNAAGLDVAGGRDPFRQRTGAGRIRSGRYAREWVGHPRSGVDGGNPHPLRLSGGFLPSRCGHVRGLQPAPDISFRSPSVGFSASRIISSAPSTTWMPRVGRPARPFGSSIPDAMPGPAFTWPRR